MGQLDGDAGMYFGSHARLDNTGGNDDGTGCFHTDGVQVKSGVRWVSIGGEGDVGGKRFDGKFILKNNIAFIQDGLRKRTELFYEKRIPQKSPLFNSHEPILDQIAKKDRFLSYPYERIKPFLTMLHEAANDEDVVSIKMTLYRVAKQSKVVEALIEAAENGKEVFVLVELKARFDEEHNIVWAKMLEKAGCHVIYGLRGLKTHSKITLIVRDEEDGICRYVHLGTGNYNDATAKLYTDCGIMTCNRMIGEDATAVFNMLSGYSEPESWNQLAVAPLWLRGKFCHGLKRN